MNRLTGMSDKLHPGLTFPPTKKDLSRLYSLLIAQVRVLSRQVNARYIFLALTSAYVTLTFIATLPPGKISPSSASREGFSSSDLSSLVAGLPSGETCLNRTGFRRWYLTNVTLRQSLTFQSAAASACHVWPEQLPRSDRIEQQLMLRPKRKPTQTKLILLYFEERAKTRLPIGQGYFVKNKCPVSGCKVTYDQTKAQEADAILFKDWIPPTLLDDTIYKRPKDQIWILYVLESPNYTADYSLANGKVNWTATYRQDSELVTPYEKFVLYDSKVRTKRQSVNYAANKKKKVAWFVSNCQTANNRMDYAQELAKYIDVDIFGGCGQNKCDKRSKKCQDILQRDYKFYLSFENSDCWWYITEKLWIPLRSNVVPIVMGAPRLDYEAVAPYKSFIHVADFDSPKELAKHLHHLDQSDKEYNSYFRWKGTGELIDTRFYCRLCAMLHADDMPVKSYRDIQHWWAGPQTCSSERMINPVINNLMK